jgi:hypothetical protein
LARKYPCYASQPIEASVATHRSEHRRYGSGVDAFGDHVERKGMPELRDRADDRVVARIRKHAGSEGPVDLQLLDRKLG